MTTELQVYGYIGVVLDNHGDIVEPGAIIRDSLIAAKSDALCYQSNMYPDGCAAVKRIFEDNTWNLTYV